MPEGPARSLRVHLLRLLLPPIAALLALGSVAAYFPTIEPATEAYDQALVDVGIALGAHIRDSGGTFQLALAPEVEQVLRADRFDTIYYQVLAPDGGVIAGDPDLPRPPPEANPDAGLVAFDAVLRGGKVRVVSVQVPCGQRNCAVQVAETTVKRTRLVREILFTSLFPELLIACATLVIVWFGVERGLRPLARLSEEIKARASDDLRPIDPGQAPAETRPLVAAINGLLERVAEASRNQQRFLANAAHQLRTPLAGLQAHTELALKQPVPELIRSELEQVHLATARTARLANQLLALARAEPGGGYAEAPAEVDLKAIVEDTANEWAHRAFG